MLWKGSGKGCVFCGVNGSDCSVEGLGNGLGWKLSGDYLLWPVLAMCFLLLLAFFGLLCRCL